MPDPSPAGVAGVIGVGGCRLEADWAWTKDSAEPVCAGGAENIPTLAAELAAEFVPTGAGTAYVVLAGENTDVCCSGAVGYRDKNIVLVMSHKVHTDSNTATAIKIIWTDLLKIFYSMPI